MAAVEQVQTHANILWTLVAACLVFWMQAGFAFVESGFTRAKNAAHIMMKNVGDFSIAAVGFWILGFGLMFGNGNPFLGTTGFFVSPDTGHLYQALSWTSVPTMTAWLFHLMFCATSATIVAGAMAERTKFVSYLVFSFFISLLFYPMVGKWIWGGDGLRRWVCWTLPVPQWCIPRVRGSRWPGWSVWVPRLDATAIPEHLTRFRAPT